MGFSDWLKVFDGFGGLDGLYESNGFIGFDELEDDGMWMRWAGWIGLDGMDPSDRWDGLDGCDESDWSDWMDGID